MHAAFLGNGKFCVSPIPSGSVRPGDIVLYRIGEKNLLHRVWWRRGRALWIKDDTGTVSLHKIPESRVLGILEARRPLSRGWLGLIYGLTNTALFVLGRKIKKNLINSKSAEPRKKTEVRGFTLLELMIVVSIIGILATIVLPKISAMIQKSNEGATRGRLGTVRSALSIYYANNDGQYPADFSPLTQPGNIYLKGDLQLYTAPHGATREVHSDSTQDFTADTGTWGYAGDSPAKGNFWVKCTRRRPGKELDRILR